MTRQRLSVTVKGAPKRDGDCPQELRWLHDRRDLAEESRLSREVVWTCCRLLLEALLVARVGSRCGDSLAGLAGGGQSRSAGGSGPRGSAGAGTVLRCQQRAGRCRRGAGTGGKHPERQPDGGPDGPAGLRIGRRPSGRNRSRAAPVRFPRRGRQDQAPAADLGDHPDTG